MAHGAGGSGIHVVLVVVLAAGADAPLACLDAGDRSVEAVGELVQDSDGGQGAVVRGEAAPSSVARSLR